MSVSFVSGDLTTIDHPAVIIQQVNCQNVMGAGLAGGDRDQIITGLTRLANQSGAQLYLVDYSHQRL